MYLFSDSFSGLLSLRNKKIEKPLIKLQSILNTISNSNEIIICWIPSHIGVRGNKRADLTAESALDQTPDQIKIPYTHLKPTINKFLLTKWQQRWNNNIHNKLFQIQLTLVEWRPALRKSREQVTISRLEIGHTRLAYSFILK